MALPTDPMIASATPIRAIALQAPDLCPWCLGAGQYLDPLDCDVGHAYLPVVCECCGGRGRKAA
jgi:hypothetical protein